MRAHIVNTSSFVDPHMREVTLFSFSFFYAEEEERKEEKKKKATNPVRKTAGSSLINIESIHTQKRKKKKRKSAATKIQYKKKTQVSI